MPDDLLPQPKGVPPPLPPGAAGIPNFNIGPPGDLLGDRRILHQLPALDALSVLKLGALESGAISYPVYCAILELVVGAAGFILDLNVPATVSWRVHKMSLCVFDAAHAVRRILQDPVTVLAMVAARQSPNVPTTAGAGALVAPVLAGRTWVHLAHPDINANTYACETECSFRADGGSTLIAEGAGTAGGDIAQLSVLYSELPQGCYGGP